MTDRPTGDRKQTTAISLPPTLRDRLDRYAEERCLSRSSAIRIAVTEFLAREAHQDRTTTAQQPTS